MVIDLRQILMDHADWRRGEGTGKCANLSGADLSGANLSGARYGEHKVSALVGRVYRLEDPYEFLSWAMEDGLFIKAGCRFLALQDYRQHIVEKYPETSKAEETNAILNVLESRYSAWKKKGR